MKPKLHLAWHLGMGDAILCNGLVRTLVERGERLVLPAYPHNLQSVRFMFRDLPHVEVVAVVDDYDLTLLVHKKLCLRLGYYGNPGFNPDVFDWEFYRQADVPFENRWSKFHVDIKSKQVARGNTAFVHHDPDRGFSMRSDVSNLPMFRPTKTGNIFDHWHDLKSAKEVHCINSSFLILADSMEDQGQKLFFHHYARPTKHPQLKRDWKKLC